MLSCNVLIIGAGASGLMCALTAAQRGRNVLIVDHANKAGKKILMSGGGRCNFTNIHTQPQNFISQNPHFCKSALTRFTPWDFIELVQRYQIPFHEKTLGQLFCQNKSKDILNMLLQECSLAGVKICLNTTTTSITQNSLGFVVETNLDTIQTQSLVIASGGLSIPTLGASGFGYKIARQFGHEVLPTNAALVPFTITDQFKTHCATLAGTSLDCIVSCNKQSFRENLLFTHRGLSGPAMLQISSYWQLGHTLHINIMPELDVITWLKTQQKERPNAELKTLLAEKFTKKMAAFFVEHWFHSKPMKRYNSKQLQTIANQLEDWQIIPSGTEGYRTAEVTLGGVSTTAISSKTMQSQLTKNLYFIGEVLDVTGHLGGFNFQWAWASGHAAGLHC